MITYCIGAIGAGKSVYAAKIAHMALKKKLNVYSMTSIKGCKQLEKSDFMKYNIEFGIVLIDESGIHFGNRDWKATPAEVIEFCKTSRHYYVDIYILSQDGDDTDSKLRKLATRILLIKPFIRFGKKTFVSIAREISKTIDIDKNDKQLKEMYIKSPSFQVNFNFKYFKLFDSHERKLLPEKKWNIFS